MLAWLRQRRGWLIWVEFWPPVLLTVFAIWAGDWAPILLSAALFFVPLLLIEAICRWHDHRVLSALRSGIKRVRGKSVIPTS